MFTQQLPCNICQQAEAQIPPALIAVIQAVFTSPIWEAPDFQLHNKLLIWHYLWGFLCNNIWISFNCHDAFTHTMNLYLLREYCRGWAFQLLLLISSICLSNKAWGVTIQRIPCDKWFMIPWCGKWLQPLLSRAAEPSATSIPLLPDTSVPD